MDLFGELYDVVGLTLRLAAVTTAALLLLAAPLAWWLAQGRTRLKDLITAVTAVPLILPPTVLGFYLLILLGPNSALMAPLQLIGIRSLAFTFTGLVIGSCVYSLPFAVQPLRNAFAGIGKAPLEAASLLGANRITTFWRVVLPLARQGVITAAVLVFAHTVGEFGVVMMIGGAIPGKTEVVSIRMYQLVEQLNWPEAHMLAGGLAAFALLVILSVVTLDQDAKIRAL